MHKRREVPSRVRVDREVDIAVDKTLSSGRRCRLGEIPCSGHPLGITGRKIDDEASENISNFIIMPTKRS